MNKSKFKGFLYLGIATLILFYASVLYRGGGFSGAFTLTLFGAMAGAGIFYAAGYRLLGAVPAWAAMAMGLVVCLFGCQESGTALLLWAFGCGTPLAVSLVWSRRSKIRPLSMAALPLAGGIWLMGALLYSKLHFGSWALNAPVARIAEKYLVAVEQMEQIYRQIYPEGFPDQLIKMLEMMRGMDQTIGFFCIVFIAYALFGCFFLSVWAADRMAQKRILGSWAVLIPPRSVSWIFMLGYFFSMFLAEPHYTTITATFHLFGFFYVFTALYALLQFLRRKNCGRFLRRLIIGGLFVLAYCSAGNSLVSVYSLLMMAGLVIATMPRIVIIKKNP